MRTVVLLSRSRHPGSGRACLSRLEAQAVRLAADLGEASGLHAGPDLDGPADALGHGLHRLTHLVLGAGRDPVVALADALRGEAPDLVLAGARADGGEDTGLVPYMLAAQLGWPLVAEAVAVAVDPAAGTLTVTSALPRGARRLTTVRGPAVVTVHQSAPPSHPFAYARARAGEVTVRLVDGPPDEGLEERPYRRRPKVAVAPEGRTASERFASERSTGRLMADPLPDDAARAILDLLRAKGVLRLP